MADRSRRPRPTHVIVLALIVALPALTRAHADTPPAGAKAEKASLPVDRLVGTRQRDFTLVDVVTGKPVSLYGFRGKRAVVVAFLGTDCPVGNLYAPRLEELAREFAPKGVQFLGINANAHETPAQVAAYVKERGLTFPVLKDPGNRVADSLLAERTCEILVIDGKARVRYRGAVDDQYGFGTRRDASPHNYLRDALAGVLAGGPVPVKATPVVGCLLDRVEPVAAKSAGQRVRAPSGEALRARAEADGAAAAPAGPVSFAADVAPIVQNRCQSCHRPGEVGPFPLATYDDARKHAAMIREVVDQRRMPPWHADPRYGHFANDRSLSPRERATLLAWVDQGTPLGDVARLPPPRSFPDGWTIGTPDVVLEIPKPIPVPAQGTVEYVHVRVPTRFKEDMWVRAAEARPTDRAVVHHIIAYIDDHKGSGPGLEGSTDSHLCGYAPGDMPSAYPEGTAKLVPAGSDLIFEIHYTPNGTVATDRSKVGLIFAKAPVRRRAHTLGIVQAKFEIPPGAAAHEVRSTFTFPADAHLLSFMPHMHLRGKDFRYDVTYPDGRTEVLLSVPAYDFGWQSYYTLAEPKAMPKGTRIDCTAHFDNSPANPSLTPEHGPSETVRWGAQTWEEMMIGYIDYVDDAAPPSSARGADLSKAAR